MNAEDSDDILGHVQASRESVSSFATHVLTRVTEFRYQPPSAIETAAPVSVIMVCIFFAVRETF